MTDKTGDLTNRKLLELAAKAAGYKLMGWSDYFMGFHCNESYEDCWNPLTSDGDALRLAVAMNMTLRLTANHGKSAEALFFKGGIQHKADFSGYPENDPWAATRRAIVRAAAEIGRGM